MPGEEYDGQRLPSLRQPALQLESVQSRHGHVEHQTARTVCVPARQERFRRIRTSRRSIPPRAGRAASDLRTAGSSSTRKMVSIFSHRSNQAGCCAGQVTQNVAPPSGLLARSGYRGARRTIDWQIASPMPMPPALVLQNASNTCSMSCGAMPVPRSMTQSRTSAPSVRSRPPACARWPRRSLIASAAFRMRFNSTCCSWTRPPSIDRQRR